MNVLPVIEREMRVQARLTLTYWLRVLGVLTLLLAMGYYALSHRFGGNLGGALFSYLNVALFASIWIAVPLLTADCISREKREGTLGLLFLTPLKARDIVLAKGLVHGLRAVMLWLAVCPVLTIPFLMGGVTWKEAVFSILINFSCICWALAAGLLGSTIGKAWVRSLLCACMLGVLFLFTFLVVLGSSLILFMVVAVPSPSGARHLPRSEFLDAVLGVGFFGATGINGCWAQALAWIPAARHAEVLWMAAAGAGGSALLVLVVILVCARTLRRTWQEEPPSARRVWWQKALCTPIVAVSFLRRWTRRTLERNPIGWLEQRTWSGRLVMWGWFAVMVSLYSLSFSQSYSDRGFEMMQRFMAQLLVLSMAVSAAGSFRRERETGVLELLLVSPVNEWQIIGGRLRGLWGQFLPAMVILFSVWAYFEGAFGAGTHWPVMRYYLSCFLTVPVVGLYFSLRRGNFISALLLTLVLQIGVPVALQRLSMNAIGYSVSGGYFRGTSPVINRYYDLDCLWTPVIIQFLIAAWLLSRLHEDLARRNFTFDRSVN